MKISFTKILLATVAAAVIFRLAFFLFALERLPTSTDEAWPGLMARHVLKGELPIFYWGQNYMGAQECYLEAGLFILLGATKLSIRLLPLAVALLFLWVSYQLARRIYNSEVAVLTLLLLAVPVPYLTMCGTMIPPPNYLAIATLGSLALILVHRIVFGKSAGFRHFAALGAVLGYAFWLHLAIASYLAVVLLFLFFKDKLLVFRPAFWGLCFVFFLAGAPLWWFNWQHDFITFSEVGGQSDWASTRQMLQVALTYTVQFFTGLRVMLYGDSHLNAALPPYLFYPLSAIWIGALALVVIANMPKLWRLSYLSLKNVDGTALLLAMAAASVAVFARGERSGSNEARFLSPLLSVLPIILAYGVRQLKRWIGRWSYLVLGFVLIAQAWGNILLAKAWNNPAFVAGPLELPDTRPLIKFFEEQDIRHAYAHYWLSYRLTYETQERLIVAEPYNERFPGGPVKFLDLVSAADKAAFITHPTLGIGARDLETLLGGIGGAWQKTNITCFTVFYNFQPPCGDERALREIPREPWGVTATLNPEDAALMLDGKTDTAWTSAAPQTSGLMITVDLGAVHTMAKLRFDLGDSSGDYQRGSRIEVSTDNENWQAVFQYGDVAGGLFWENNQPRFLVRGDFFTCAFAPAAARYVRITQTGSDPRYWWTIAELRAFGPQH
ncbi:MAG: discoidin domain-containing protein [Lentisphaerae bacterium]|nr:discoidin domain-containing protein [Lentisphaerota bacterium]